MTDEFAAFELAGWRRVANRYEDAWSALTRQFIPPLLDALSVGPGDRLLDAACGPGYIAEEAARRGAEVRGVDFAPEMIALARRRLPDYDFRIQDAQALSEPAASYDVVAINFGLLHMAQPGRALAEARRVLRPGGRLGFSVWAGPDRSTGARIVDAAIRSHANMEVALPQGPDYYMFQSPDAIAQTLHHALFRPESIRTAVTNALWHVPTPEFVFEAERGAGVRTAGLLAQQEPAVLKRIRDDIAAQVRRFPDGTGFALPFAAMLVVAAA
jgi:ubiquinone/menaquinone biosynthesis C-methylase UbiE